MYHFRRALATLLGPTLLVATLLGVLVFGAAGCAHENAVDRALTESRRGRDDLAIQILEREVAEHPDAMGARKLLVRLYAIESDLVHARAEIDEIERRSPKGDPTPFIELGHAYELTHRFEEALAAYDQAADIAPTSPVGPREGGMRAARWGEVEVAEPRLAEAIRRGARDPETWHALGIVRVHLGDLDGADNAYRQGAAADHEKGGDGAENLLGLATVAVLRDDAKGALTSYDAVLAQRPRFGPAELGRAWALAKLGRGDDASHALEHARELGVAPSEIERARRAMKSLAVPVDQATPRTP